jgi:CRP/FNR family transcriptional regulator
MNCPHQGLRDAQPSRVVLGSPCGACAVRPLSFCSDLTIEELADLERIATKITVNAGAPIFDEGEPAAHRYNVTNGCARIYKLLGDGRRQIIGFLFPGDFLGLANEEIYAYGAEAVANCDLCRFPRRKLEDLVSRVPTLKTRLYGVARKELAIAQEQILLLGRKRAMEKVATMLLMFSKRAERRSTPDNPVFMPMIREDMGDYLGLTTETVSRTITQLKTKGVIRLEAGNKVRLLDIDALVAMSEGF